MVREPNKPVDEDDEFGEEDAPTIRVDALDPAELSVLLSGDVQLIEVEEDADATRVAPTVFPEPPPADPEPPSRGPRLGRYSLRKRLGVGGMAEVFLAEQDGPAGFRKQVVVKRILPQLTASPKFVELFLREARLAATLNHSNIVQIYELGEDEGQYFIAMEYVDGATLHQLAKICWHFHRPLPFELVIGPAADAALGLHYAHHLLDEAGEPAGLVHRDISPDNLMLNREGITKILDFGVAKGLAAAAGSNTRVGELKGKIPFMAPEVIRGAQIDGRVDLYALGVCMYWLLTGHRPHIGDNDADLLDSVLKKEPASPRSLNPTVPIELDALVMCLLQKDRDKRPPNGEVLHDLLVQILPVQHRLTAPFVRQILGWGSEIAAGIPPGERPRTFIPAGPASLYQNGAPGIPGVGALMGPVPTPSSLSVSPTSDLQRLLETAEMMAAKPDPEVTRPAQPRVDIDSELNSQVLAEAGISLDELASDAAAGASASQEPSQDIGALLADTLDELGGPTRTGMQINPVSFEEAAPAPPPVIDSADSTVAWSMSEEIRRPRAWFALGTFLGLLVVLGAWLIREWDRPPETPSTVDERPGNTVPVAGATEDSGTLLVQTPQGVIEFDPDQLGAGGDDNTGAGVDGGSPARGDSGSATSVASAHTQDAAAEPTADNPPGQDDARADRHLQPEPREPRSPRPSQRIQQVRAPRHVQWLSDKQRGLGRGTDRLSLSKNARHVYAYDTRRQVMTRVSVEDGVIDYGKLPRGSLAVRAFPFAVVSLGKDKIGTTPFAPLDVVVGTYKVTLQHEQTTKVITVEVRSGQTALVKANMTEP
ncbi:MAG: serine/threonine-protein kinase [Pseudomonadota bacterium]